MVLQALTGLSGVSGLLSGGSPVTYLSDTFTDTTGTHLNVHTMDIGAGWTEQGASSWTISSNQAVQATSTSATFMATADAGHADVTAQVTITFASTSRGQADLISHFQDTQNMWRLRADTSNANTTLYEVGAGIASARATVAGQPALGSTHTLKCVWSGANVTIYYDSNSTAFSTDGQFTSLTVVGMSEFRSGVINSNQFDNFLVTS